MTVRTLYLCFMHKKLYKSSARVHIPPPDFENTTFTCTCKQNQSHLDLDLDLDLDLERREPSFEPAGERLVDIAEPRGDALLEPGRESWTDQTLK